MFRALRYFFVQGCKNIWNNKLMGVASIGIVAASLVLLSIFQLAILNLNNWISQVEQQCEINVYLENELDGTNINRIKSELSAIENVSKVTFFSKDERVQRTKETTYKGREYMLEDLEKDNIVRDSYILTVTSLTEASAVAELAAKVPGVDEVVNRQDLIDKIRVVADMIRQIGFWLMLLLILIAMFIIANTIRIGLISHSGEINIMRFVGASNSYIRGPFMVEGILLGILGAVVAGGLIFAGYILLSRSAISFFPDMGQALLLPLSAIWKVVTVTSLEIGAGIGLIGSGISIRKHLKV